MCQFISGCISYLYVLMFVCKKTKMAVVCSPSYLSNLSNMLTMSTKHKGYYIQMICNIISIKWNNHPPTTLWSPRSCLQIPIHSWTYNCPRQISSGVTLPSQLTPQDQMDQSTDQSGTKIVKMMPKIFDCSIIYPQNLR